MKLPWHRARRHVFETIYHVHRSDGEAMGDFGGFDFHDPEEARQYIRDEYAEESKLIASGYYEYGHEIPVLQIDTMEVIDIEVVLPLASYRRSQT